MHSRPIAEGLFTWPLPEPPGAAALIGSRCDACGAYAFPGSHACASCGSDECTAVELASRGRLYTWTTQEFLPKAPYSGTETDADFRPWAIGYIELPDQLRVESRLYDVEPEALSFGQEFELVIRPFRQDEDGTDVFAFGFCPVKEEASHA